MDTLFWRQMCSSKVNIWPTFENWYTQLAWKGLLFRDLSSSFPFVPRDTRSRQIIAPPEYIYIKVGIHESKVFGEWQLHDIKHILGSHRSPWHGIQDFLFFMLMNITSDRVWLIFGGILWMLHVQINPNMQIYNTHEDMPIFQRTFQFSTWFLTPRVAVQDQWAYMFRGSFVYPQWNIYMYTYVIHTYIHVYTHTHIYQHTNTCT